VYFQPHDISRDEFLKKQSLSCVNGDDETMSDDRKKMHKKKKGNEHKVQAVTT